MSSFYPCIKFIANVKSKSSVADGNCVDVISFLNSTFTLNVLEVPAANESFADTVDPSLYVTV